MRVNLPEIGELVKALRTEADALDALSHEAASPLSQSLHAASVRMLQYSNRLDRAVTT